MINEDFEEVKNTEIFPGKTFSDLLKDVFDLSIEERTEALSAYREFKSMIKGDDDLFLNGDKLDKFLRVAQDSSDNIIKMLGVAQKLIEQKEKKNNENEENGPSIDSATLIDMLEQQNIGPKRFADKKKNNNQIETTEEEESSGKIVPFFKTQSNE